MDWKLLSEDLKGRDPKMSLSQGREWLDNFTGRFPFTEGTLLKELPIQNGVRLFEFAPERTRDDKTVILYLHGGGYIRGSVKSHGPFCSYLAAKSGITISFLEYRLSPEFDFPSQVLDAVNAYKLLLNSGKKIVLIGDSAGGGLVLALAIAIRSLQLPTPLALCFLSPWVDMTLEGSSLKERKSLDPWLDPDTIFPLVKLLLKGLSPRNQFASPLFAAMNGLPPAYIQVGTDEVLFSDSENLANRFDMFGNSVRFDIFENRFHVFQLFAPVNRDAAEATDKIVSFIQSFI